MSDPKYITNFVKGDILRAFASNNKVYEILGKNNRTFNLFKILWKIRVIQYGDCSIIVSGVNCLSNDQRNEWRNQRITFNASDQTSEAGEDPSRLWIFETEDSRLNLITMGQATIELGIRTSQMSYKQMNRKLWYCKAAFLSKVLIFSQLSPL